MVEGYISLNIFRDDRIFWIRHFFRLVEEIEYPFSSGSRLLQDVRNVGDFQKGLLEKAHVLDKRLNIANHQAPLNDLVTANNCHSHIPDVTNEVHNGSDHGRE